MRTISTLAAVGLGTLCWSFTATADPATEYSNSADLSAAVEAFSATAQPSVQLGKPSTYSDDLSPDRFSGLAAFADIPAQSNVKLGTGMRSGPSDQSDKLAEQMGFGSVQESTSTGMLSAPQGQVSLSAEAPVVLGLGNVGSAEGAIQSFSAGATAPQIGK